MKLNSGLFIKHYLNPTSSTKRPLKDNKVSPLPEDYNAVPEEWMGNAEELPPKVDMGDEMEMTHGVPALDTAEARIKHKNLLVCSNHLIMLIFNHSLIILN